MITCAPFEKSPNWADAQIALSATLLKPAIAQFGYPMLPDSTGVLPEDCVGRVEESREILNGMIERLGKGFDHNRDQVISCPLVY